MHLRCSLTRQPSKRVTGDPFIVKEVVAVDMFPHTEHYELVMLLERNNADSALDQKWWVKVSRLSVSRATVLKRQNYVVPFHSLCVPILQLYYHYTESSEDPNWLSSHICTCTVKPLIHAGSPIQAGCPPGASVAEVGPIGVLFRQNAFKFRIWNQVYRIHTKSLIWQDDNVSIQVGPPIQVGGPGHTVTCCSRSRRAGGLY